MGNDVNAMDFRSYSPENIESLEVLKGVVLAEYGDLTSGAVLVKTKADVLRWRLNSRQTHI